MAKMGYNLRHIVLPHSLHSYQQLRKELLNNDANNDIKNNEKNNEKNDIIKKNENEIIKNEPSDEKKETLQNIEDLPLPYDLNMLASISSITTADKKNVKKVRDFFDKIKSGSEEGKKKNNAKLLGIEGREECFRNEANL